MEIKDTFANSGNYKDTYILLDTGSTASVFNNPRMLINIRGSKNTMRAYSNGGHQDTDKVGYFSGMFQVWFNPKSLLNILSLSNIRAKFRITIDTAVASCIMVHIGDGKILRFEEVNSGLYLLHNNKDTKTKVSAHSFSTLVK